MRRHLLPSVTALTVTLAVLAAAPTGVHAAGPQDTSTRAAGSRATHGIVVVYRRGLSARTRLETRQQAGAASSRTLGRARFQLVTPTRGHTVAATIRSLRHDPRVLAAVRDQVFRLQSVPDDPRFTEQWGLQNTGQDIGTTAGTPGADIHATQAWDRTTGSPSVVVADLDTGYRFDQPDLAPVAYTNPGEIAGNGIDDDGDGFADDVHGWDFIDNDADPTDPGFYTFGGQPVPVATHGVHTAGIIGAHGDDGVGVTGVTQNSRILPVRVCSSQACLLSAILSGINYAGRLHARAANLSLTSYPTDAATVLAFLSAFAANSHTLYVAAAGNDSLDADGAGAPPLPCAADPAKSDPAVGYQAAKGAVDNVICVAATDQDDALASFSNTGAVSVDLGAPGVNILSTSFSTDAGVYNEDFSGDDFDSWTTPVPPASADDQGFSRFELAPGVDAIASDPLPSLGQPSTQAPGTTRATQSSMIDIGAQYQQCTVSFAAGASMSGDDAFSWNLSVDGTSVVDEPVNASPQNGTNTATFAIPPSSTDHDVRIGFTFAHGVSGSATPFAAVRGISMGCLKGDDRYDSGTSMAAPFVTGTAALLFSLKPTATVTQVRKAILAGVDPDPSLAGVTVTGGRLDVWKAMSLLLPLDTRITSGPNGRTRARSATFSFDTNHTGNATGFLCRLDSGAFTSCTSAATYAGLKPGAHTFRVRSVLPGTVDATPAVRRWTVLR